VLPGAVLGGASCICDAVQGRDAKQRGRGGSSSEPSITPRDYDVAVRPMLVRTGLRAEAKPPQINLGTPPRYEAPVRSPPERSPLQAPR
jgi:hypothetical protein